MAHCQWQIQDLGGTPEWTTNERYKKTRGGTHHELFFADKYANTFVVEIFQCLLFQYTSNCNLQEFRYSKIKNGIA